jgi:hypothetical protein
MTKFADQLFDDLIRDHGSTLAHARPPAPGRPVASRRALLAAGTGFVAVAATVGGLMASGGGLMASGGGTPAYALTTHPDGAVTLDVYTESGIAGINTKLHQVGDDQVVVVPVGPGCPSMASLPAPAVPPDGHIAVQTSASVNGNSVTVNAKGIPAGDILVVGFERTDNNGVHTGLGGAKLTTPPAPSCVSLPPAPPPGDGGSGSSSGTAG